MEVIVNFMTKVRTETSLIEIITVEALAKRHLRRGSILVFQQLCQTSFKILLLLVICLVTMFAGAFFAIVAAAVFVNIVVVRFTVDGIFITFLE
jgi:hypothetical protein